MPSLTYGVGAYSRARGNLPELALVNMHVEQSRTDEKGVVLQSRKGLSVRRTVGVGPIRATFQNDGVFGGDEFVLSGDEFYRGNTLLGAVVGDGVATIVASFLEVLVCAGGAIYSYNGTNFVAVAFPDGKNVLTIGYVSNYFIAIPIDAANGPGTWYFSALLDGRDWDGIDFANAETSPDGLKDIAILDGVINFLGTESVEMWAESGDPALPFTQIQQRVFEVGVSETGCVVVIDNTFFWHGSDGIVYRNGDVPQAVSDDGIVERSAASSTHRLFRVDDERHKFVVLRNETNTMAYDVTTGQWCEWASYGRANFRAGPGLGDTTDGTLWRFDGYLDADDVFERRFRAATPLKGPAIINNVRLQCEVGTTSYLTGQYAAPQIELRDSDDAGNTWSDWEPEDLGAQGEYNWRVEWRGRGMFAAPGYIAEFRVTDPISFRLSDVEVNAAGGGRA